jgi:glutathione S-transferase
MLIRLPALPLRCIMPMRGRAVDADCSSAQAPEIRLKPYQLYYWPTIQGRGEFVRLALEEADVDYDDVARLPETDGMGMAALLHCLDAGANAHPAFAPPVLKCGDDLVAQTANILLFLGPRVGLAPRLHAARSWCHQLQLTIADLVGEVHDTHHPVSVNLYYEDQKNEAKRRASDFTSSRLPKFLGYFEQILQAKRGPWSVGSRLSYVDLSLFQVIAGLRYAFPHAMARLAPDCHALIALHDRVASRPHIARYLASERRLPFGEDDLFRHYPELDEAR